MRRCTFFTLLMGMLCLLISKNSFAQVVRKDSSSQQSAFNNSLALYYNSVGKESPLYNGVEYSFYDPLFKGTAYFLDVKAFSPGNIYYDRVLFNNVPMLYDLYADKVVVLLYNKFTKFTLINSKVTAFDYMEHHFINIDADTIANNTVIKSGYYDELYKGKVQVLAKRSKSLQSTAGNQTESYFDLTQDYYIRKGNVYYSISSQGSLLAVLKDKKKELQQYMRANDIKYRRTPEEAMVKIASYYDQLTK